MMGDTCRSCRWWEEAPDLMGACRRYAPKPWTAAPPITDVPYEVWWPLTREDDWCGEHHSGTIYVGGSVSIGGCE